MASDSHALERAARFTTFATLGILGTTQELAQRVLEAAEGSDPELVAEETLCLVSTATARAAAVALRASAEVAAAVVPALVELPFSYRDYLVGAAMIEQRDASLLDSNAEVYNRLQRKRDFYDVQLPPDQFPGERVLQDKMVLWMGRVSPPGLPEHPAERMHRLELVPLHLTHLKLVLAFGRRING